MKWCLAGCPTCGGDLYLEGLDEQWFTCLMCARSFEARQLLTLPEVRIQPHTMPARRQQVAAGRKEAA